MLNAECQAEPARGERLLLVDGEQVGLFHLWIVVANAYTKRGKGLAGRDGRRGDGKLACASALPPRPMPRPFKGNKSFLPAKPCAACGRPMSWRHAWAKNWDELRYCSDACRRRKTPPAR